MTTSSYELNTIEGCQAFIANDALKVLRYIQLPQVWRAWTTFMDSTVGDMVIGREEVEHLDIFDNYLFCEGVSRSKLCDDVNAFQLLNIEQ